MINLARRLLPKPIKSFARRVRDFITWDPWASRSWSQEGEDLILRRLFEKQKKGFYVDVGAHHPKRFSNTYLLYRRGWMGINIDAMPGSMKSFKATRPRDINLEIGIALEEGFREYFAFNDSALNGLSAELSQQRSTAGSRYHLTGVTKVAVKPLGEVLRQFAGNRSIDFLTVDVEGLDLEVLQSNDWTAFRPRYVLAEALGSSLKDLQNAALTQFMGSHGYILFAKQVNTVFFRDSEHGCYDTPSQTNDIA